MTGRCGSPLPPAGRRTGRPAAGWPAPSHRPSRAPPSVGGWVRPPARRRPQTPRTTRLPVRWAATVSATRATVSAARATVSGNTADSQRQHGRQSATTRPTVSGNTADSQRQHGRQSAATRPTVSGNTADSQRNTGDLGQTAHVAARGQTTGKRDNYPAPRWGDWRNVPPHCFLKYIRN